MPSWKSRKRLSFPDAMPYQSGSAAVLRVDAEPAKEFQLLTALPLKADVMPRIAWPAWGQTEKNSVRAYVFRFTVKLGHRSMQSACLKRAKSGSGLLTNEPSVAVIGERAYR
jgi:hypothetical protein